MILPWRRRSRPTHPEVRREPRGCQVRRGAGELGPGGARRRAEPRPRGAFPGGSHAGVGRLGILEVSH